MPVSFADFQCGVLATWGPGVPPRPTAWLSVPDRGDLFVSFSLDYRLPLRLPAGPQAHPLTSICVCPAAELTGGRMCVPDTVLKQNAHSTCEDRYLCLRQSPRWEPWVPSKGRTGLTPSSTVGDPEGITPLSGSHALSCHWVREWRPRVAVLGQCLCVWTGGLTLASQTSSAFKGGPELQNYISQTPLRSQPSHRSSSRCWEGRKEEAVSIATVLVSQGDCGSPALAKLVGM